jgi:muramoyltetrapeptide carboxypeptidase
MGTRRRFLHDLTAIGAAGTLAATGLGTSALPGAATSAPAPLRPPPLLPGGTIGLCSPAGASYTDEALVEVEAMLATRGYRTKRAPGVLATYGYLGGTDAERAADLNALFADPEVDAVLPLRGGWGCARLLPLLDYDQVRRTPKVACGFSDVTSLLSGLYAQTGLVGFHGPVGVSTWNPFTLRYWLPAVAGGTFEAREAPDALRTLTSGIAEGPLFGGNLTVLSALVGTPYFPDLAGHVLFLEDVGEEPYRVDRMLTHLRLSGALDRVAAVYFGDCRRCEASPGFISLTLDEVLRDHLGALGVPAWKGRLVGHIEDKLTLPIGARARVDARTGTITLLEAATA